MYKDVFLSDGTLSAKWFMPDYDDDKQHEYLPSLECDKHRCHLWESVEMRIVSSSESFCLLWSSYTSFIDGVEKQYFSAMCRVVRDRFLEKMYFRFEVKVNAVQSCHIVLEGIDEAVIYIYEHALELLRIKAILFRAFSDSILVLNASYCFCILNSQTFIFNINFCVILIATKVEIFFLLKLSFNLMKLN